MADISVTAAQVGVVFPLLAEIYHFICAETITAGQAVYQLSDGTIGVADANAGGKGQFRGIALEGGGAGQAISVLKRGFVYGFDLSGMNADALAYLSDTAGAIADAASITLAVNVGRVGVLTDATPSKVLWVEADWLRDWA